MPRSDIKLVLLVLSVAVLGLTTSASADDIVDEFEYSLDKTDSKAEISLDSGTRTKSRQSVNVDSKQGGEMVKQMEANMLRLFGFKSRPARRDNVVVPQHMIDLYKRMTGEDVDLDFNRKSSHVKLYPGNTIRSLYNEVSDDSTTAPHIANFYFNVSSMPADESLQGNELRIYRHRANDSNVHPKDGQITDSINKPHRIAVYDVIRPSTDNSEVITRLIDSKWVYPHKSKWESFDISPALHRWIKSPEKNYGLQVHFTDTMGGVPELEHVRLRRSVHISDRDWSVQQPVLVVYSDDGKDAHIRKRREADPEAKKRKRNKAREAAKEKKKRKNHCKRHPLFVDFQSVGWRDWIIAPAGYDAYFCHGECPFYMPDHLNTTNHAIVQNMVNSFNPQAAPKPCCVPTDLSDIAMLYLDDEGKVVLKTYQEMVVEGCGCR